MPTQKEVKEILKYYPKTGEFIWKVKPSRKIRAGSVAGHLNKLGYIQIKISGKLYQVHRLAWLYVYGYFPEHNIDHIDRNPSNTRINNLRHATQQCNIRNVGLYHNNTSGIKGVGWHKRVNKWYAQIAVNYKNHQLGYFTDFIEAVCTRLAAEQCLGWPSCDSNTSANDYVNCNLRNEL